MGQVIDSHFHDVKLSFSLPELTARRCTEAFQWLQTAVREEKQGMIAISGRCGTWGNRGQGRGERVDSKVGYKLRKNELG